MVGIRGGAFTMGADDGSVEETPAHRVAVQAFFLDRTEVTVAAYARCVDAGRCTEPNDGGSCNWGRRDRSLHPVNCVDWHQAKAYCSWLGKRLPTEAEWEFAARAGSLQLTYPWGEEKPADQLCWNRKKRDQTTCPVGAHPASASGLLDMAGNVWEWVEDRYHPYAVAEDAEAASELRVNRGGGWDCSSPACIRGSTRNANRPSLRHGLIGFRCAR